MQQASLAGQRRATADGSGWRPSTSGEIHLVGPDPVATEAIARALCRAALPARRSSSSEGAIAVEQGTASAVVLVPGPGIDATRVLEAVRLNQSVSLVVAAPAPATPPADGGLRPVFVGSLEELITVLSRALRPTAESGLTPRHVEILQQLAAGCTPTEAAEELGITIKTLNNHLGVAYRRLGTRNVTQAVLTAVRQGIIQLP